MILGSETVVFDPIFITVKKQLKELRTLFVILYLLFLSTSCQNNSSSEAGGSSEVQASDGLGKGEEPPTHSGFGVIHETENLRVYGDTTVDQSRISYGSLKFEPYLRFSDFRVNTIEHQKYADLDLTSNKYASMYRTRLKQGYSADTANFAGHYSLVFWGCGSGCKLAVIIDRKTGKIYDAPESSRGYKFRVDSRMLIVNPPDATGFYDDCPYCKPIIYVFDERTRKFEEKKPDFL